MHGNLPVVTVHVVNRIFFLLTIRSHRREGETEEEYQRRKRHHQQQKHGHKHHHKRRHQSSEKDENHNRQDNDDDTKRIVQGNGNNYSMYGTDDSSSDSNSELSVEGTGATENELNSSLNKGQTRAKTRKDSWFGVPFNQNNNACTKEDVKVTNSFQIQDMELDTSFEV